MPVFHDRRTGEIKDLSREDYVDSLYGSGQSGFKQLFPGEQSDALAPWSGVGGLKHRQPYEQEKVSASLRQPESMLTEVDPRNLRATQPSITRAGVEYYMGEEHRRTDEKILHGSSSVVVRTPSNDLRAWGSVASVRLLGPSARGVGGWGSTQP